MVWCSPHVVHHYSAGYNWHFALWCKNISHNNTNIAITYLKALILLNNNCFLFFSHSCTFPLGVSITPGGLSCLSCQKIFSKMTALLHSLSQSLLVSVLLFLNLLNASLIILQILPLFLLQHFHMHNFTSYPSILGFPLLSWLLPLVGNAFFLLYFQEGLLLSLFPYCYAFPYRNISDSIFD